MNRAKQPRTESGGQQLVDAAARRHDLFWLFVAAALPVGLCASRLSSDLWYDEIYTLTIAMESWSDIALDYSAPNNHVLFTLLMHPLLIFVEDEVALRLPSFLFAVVALVGTFYVARPRAGLAAAAAATLVLGLMQMFLVHAVQIRGYGLSLALVTALAVVVLRPGRTWRTGLLIAALAAALVYVMPTNVLFAAAIGCADLFNGWRRHRAPGLLLRHLAPWAAGAVVAGLLYLPIYEGVLAAAGSAVPGTVASTVRLIANVYWAALRDMVPLVVVAILGGVVLWERSRSGWVDKKGTGTRRDTHWQSQVAHEAGASPRFVRCCGQYEPGPLAALLVAMLTLPFLFTGVLRLAPFERVYCPLLPFVAVAVAWPTTVAQQRLESSLAAGGQVRAARWAGSPLVLLCLIAVSVLPWLATYPQRLAAVRRERFAQDGYFNYYAAGYHPSLVAQELRWRCDDRQPFIICFDYADELAMRYYLAGEALPTGRVRHLPDGRTAAKVFLVVPPLPHYDRIAGRYGIAADVLADLPLVKDFGYYNLHASQGELIFTPVAPDETEAKEDDEAAADS